MSERAPSQRPSLRRYLDLQRSHPRLFENPSQDGFRIMPDEEAIREIESEVAKRLEERGYPSEWAEVGIAYEDQYLTILRDAVMFPDGHRDTYIRILERDEHANGVAVLPTLGDRIVLLRHFRHATREWHQEIPRGFGSGRGSTEEDARREIEEEIEGSIRNLTSLGVVHPNTGLSAGAVHLYHAKLQSIGRPESHEAISDVLEVSVAGLEDMIADSRVTDSFTIAAYCRAKLLGIFPLHAAG